MTDPMIEPTDERVDEDLAALTDELMDEALDRVPAGALITGYKGCCACN